MEKLTLEIVTPEKIVLKDTNIDFIGIEFLGKDNSGKSEIGIMPQHAPMLVRLATAPLRYKKGKNVFYVVIAGGFLEVKDNIVTVLSAGAELVDKELDIDLAITAKKRVGKWLEGQVGKVGFDEKLAEADVKKSAIHLFKSSSHSE